MANKKITELTALTAPAADDILPIIDVSEGLSANKNKKITFGSFTAGANSGTAAAPSIAFGSDPDTGLYRSAANELSITTGGTQRVVVDSTGNTTVKGDLVVQGTTTTVSSTTITVADKNLELATGQSSDTGADGGGLTIKGASDKTWNWVDATDAWTSNQNIDVVSGKVYKIGGTEVLNATTLGSGVVNSSLTSVGTLGTLAVTGEIDAGSLDISGNADIDGTLEADAYTVNGTALNEYIADTVGAMVSGNTETNIAVTYDDSDNTLDFTINSYPAASISGTTLASNVVTSSLTSVGTLGSLAVTNAVVAGSLDISGGADIDGTLEADAYTVDGVALNEYIADTVGAMVSSNTETDITVTYNDSDNTLDFVVGNIAGNAGTATALQTARTIGGVSFNGTANIDLPGVNQTGNQNTTGSAATLTTARTIGGVSFDGSANINLPGVNAAGNQNTSGTAAGLSGTPDITVDDIIAASLDISGNADIDGTLEADAYTVNGTALNEYIADTVGSMVSSNTESDIVVTYQDSDNTLDFTVSNISGTSGGLSGTPNITVGVVTGGSLDISGNADIDGTLEADAITVDGTALNEFIADTVGAMVSSNTETNIAVTYDDSDNTLDFSVVNITGNAATATALQTARTIGGVSFDGTANITLPGVNATGNQNTTGSAATLTTARTIGGVSFNGSANIDLPGVNAAGNQNTSGTSAGLTGTPNITVADVVAASVTTSGVTNLSGELRANANVKISNVGPKISLIDTNNDDDFEIKNNDGVFTVRDATNSADRFTINSDGNVSIGGTLGSGDLTITGGQPALSFIDDGANPDYKLYNNNGVLRLYDITNTTDRLVVNTDGHVDVTGNLDVGAGLDVTGNITVTGTVDGVDIAARNTLFGGLTSSSGVLTNGVTATTQSASDNSTKVATTAYADTAVSNLVDSAPGALNTLNELAAALGDDANFSTTVTNSIATKLPLAGGTLTGQVNFDNGSNAGRDIQWQPANDRLAFFDNTKATFGDNVDIQIYHDGSNSIIQHAGGGHLYVQTTGTDEDLILKANRDIYIQPHAGETGAKFLKNGAVEIYYDNSKKLETTTNGVTITGGIIAGGLTYPTSDGSNGQVLKTNGSGTLSWTTPISAGSDLTGSSLASNIVSSSLTSVGTLTGLTTSGNILMTGTGCIDVAAGTTAQRPGSPNAGMFRYNTTLSKFEGHDGSAWGEIGGGGGGASFYINTLSSSSGTGGGSATFNGTAYRFQISNAPATGNAAQMLVSVGGVIQKANSGTSQPSEGYAIDGNDIIFGAAPASAASWFIITYGALNAGEPTDNTVNEAKLQVSNSPTNGYFLSAQSGNTGGLTWAAVDLSSKLSLTGGTLTGDVTFQGATSGRDVLWDKSGNIFHFKDNAGAQFGDSTDLKIFHDGSNSQIREEGTGNLMLISNNQIRFEKASPGEALASFNVDGACELYYDNSKKFNTYSGGVQVTGLKVLDSDKLKIGNAEDLQIFHSSGENFIRGNASASPLYIDCCENLHIRHLDTDGSNSETMIKAIGDGGVELNYNGSKKLETTANGITVYGPEGGDGVIKLYADEGDDANDKWKLTASAADADLYISNFSSGSWESNIVCKNQDAVELYYDNSKKFETTTTGTEVISTTDALLKVNNTGDGTATLMLHNTGSTDFQLALTNAVLTIGTTTEASIKATANGAVELYHNNVKKFETKSNGINVTGNVDITGSLGIPDSEKAVFGAGSDLQIYHDGSKNIIKSTNGNIEIDNNSEYMARFLTNGAVELYYNNVKKFETTAGGITITGDDSSDGTIIKGDLRLHKEGEATSKIKWDGSEGTDGHLEIFDDVKLTFGAGADLQIYHNGNHSKIRDEGTGNFYLESVDGNIYLRVNDNEQGVSILENGAVELYHNNNKRLETIAEGVKLSSPHNQLLTLSGSNDPYILFQEGTTNKGWLQWHSSGYFILKNSEDGSALRLKDAIDFQTGDGTYHSVWHAGNDGSGSGLDADTLDGVQGASYLRSDAADTFSGELNWHNDNPALKLRNTSYNTYLYLGGWDNGTNSNNIARIRTSSANLHIDSGANGSLYLNHYTAGSIYGRTFIPKDNNSFNLGASNTWWANIYGTNIYASNWFRNNQSGEGLYNQATGQHFYSSHDDYWNIAGGSSANALLFRDENGGTIRGYVYANNSNQVGLLDGNGQWCVRGIKDDTSQLFYDSTVKLSTKGWGVRIDDNCLGINTDVGNAPSTRNAFIALGDSDTGVAQNGDGQLELWANNQEIMNIDTGEVTFYKPATPGANNTYDLGSTSYRWRNLYINDLQLSNEGSQNSVDGTWGDWTLQEGEDDVFMINNRSGKKYRMALQEVS